MIDWETFRARVSVGRTECRHRYRQDAHCILMGDLPYRKIDWQRIDPEHTDQANKLEWDTNGYNAEVAIEWIEPGPFRFREWWTEITYPVSLLEYLIDGRWLSYDELMA